MISSNRDHADYLLQTYLDVQFFYFLGSEFEKNTWNLNPLCPFRRLEI